MGIVGIFFISLIVSSRGYGADCAKYKKYSCSFNKTYPIHLTFDDGPHITNTPKVLNALDKHNLQATFFAVAENLTNDTESRIKIKKAIMERIKSSGHRIGSHSFKHELHTKLSDKNLERYIRRSREILGDYFTEPQLFRLPYGDGWHPLTVNRPRAKAVMGELDRQGFSHVGWSLDADDWDQRRQRSPGILPIMMDQICVNEGGVVLLHDIQSNTANNIDEWIEALKCVGHTFAPIEQFFGADYIQMSSQAK